MPPRKYVYDANRRRRMIRYGMRVRNADCVGIDSRKEGVISDRPLSETEGWYQSITPDRWASILLADGTLTSMLYVCLIAL